MSYIVLDYWNVIISRFTDHATAVRCARANKGYIVHVKTKRYV